MKNKVLKIDIYQKKIKKFFNEKNEELFLNSIDEYWAYLNQFRNLGIKKYDDTKLETLVKSFYKSKKPKLLNYKEKRNYNVGVILVNRNDTGGLSEFKRFYSNKISFKKKFFLCKTLVLHEDIKFYKKTLHFQSGQKSLKKNFFVKSIKDLNNIEKKKIVKEWLKKNKIDFCISCHNPFSIAAMETSKLISYGTISQDHHCFLPFPNIGNTSFFLCNDQIFKYQTKPKNFLVLGLAKFPKKIISRSIPFKKSSFGLKSKDIISATTNLEKCLIAKNTVFLDLIAQLCRKNENYKHLFIGTERCKGFLDSYLKKNKDLINKIIYIGIVPDIFKILKIIDFYINSFPISGGTSVEAAMIGKPSVDFIWHRDLSIHPVQFPINANTSVYNEQDFIDICSKLIQSKKFRALQGKISRNVVKNFPDNEQTFREICKNFLNTHNSNHVNISKKIEKILNSEILNRINL